MRDGTIVHGRNLDFEYADILRKITYAAKFVRGDKILFEATMFAGCVGVYTGMKPGAFSISENKRAISQQKDLLSLAVTFEMIIAGYKSISWVMRDTLFECHNYECAYNKLNETPTISAAYVILAGTKDNEGVILSRDRTSTAHAEHLSADNWYLLQTNEDHFTGACHERCKAAN